MSEKEGRIEIRLYRARPGLDQRSRAAWELIVINQKDYASFDYAKDLVETLTKKTFVEGP